MRTLFGFSVLLLAACGGDRTATRTPESASTTLPTTMNDSATPSTQRLEKATFGAGCFWGVEQVFRKVPGVTDAAVGYTGGTTSNPSYRQICTGATGHAEVVEVTFDPQRVTYERLVDIFFKIHDPTTLNRQGPDVGDQYRSVIFCHSDEQRKVAESMKDKAGKSGRYKNPIVTFVEPAPSFWRAEEYHQRYFEKNGGPSCHVLPE